VDRWISELTDNTHVKENLVELKEELQREFAKLPIPDAVGDLEVDEN